MQNTDLITALQQYKAEGNDIAALFAAAQALPDDSKTPLGLNQWKLSDKPRMEEFNEDNRIIDEHLRELESTPQKHSLELINGFVRHNAAEYWKNQFNEVTISFRISKGGQAIPAGTHVVAVLPEEFRPVGYIPHGVAIGYPTNIPVTTYVNYDGFLGMHIREAIAAGSQATFLGSFSYLVTS